MEQKDTVKTSEIIGSGLHKNEFCRVKKYDFKRPDKFSKDQNRTLHMMHETFARLSTVALSFQLGLEVKMNVSSVDQLTYEEFIRSIPNPTTLAVINMNPLKGSSILEIDPSITFTIIDKLFGGAGESIKLNRELTHIELSVIEDIVVRILGNLREAWSNVIDLRPRMGTLETNPQFAQIVPPNDMVALISLETYIGEVTGYINFCIPYITIESIIHKLSAQYWYSSIRRNIPNESNKAIARLKVQSELFIEGEEISLKNLSALKKGDLIKLPRYNKGETCLQTGENPILNLIQPNSKSLKNFEFEIKKEAKYSQQNMEIFSGELKENDDSLKKEITKSIESSLNKIGLEIKQNQNEQNKILKDLLSHQEKLINKLSPASNKIESSLDNSDDASKSAFFEKINRVDSDYLLNLIHKEQPQTIALIISLLNSPKAGEIISRLDENLQTDVIEKIAAMNKIQPEIMRKIEKILEDQIYGKKTEDINQTGGIDKVTEIINSTNRSTEKNIIKSLENRNPDLAGQIKSRIVAFEDIAKLDDSSIKNMLSKIDLEEIALALKSADATVKQKIEDNLNEKMSASLNKLIEESGPVYLTKIEEEQQKIVNVLRSLIDKGEIRLVNPEQEQIIE